VRGCTILDTGRSSALAYGKHGIYAKGASATLVGNRIAGFDASGISIRRPDALVQGNAISGGPVGVGFFAESASGGVTRIVDNHFEAIGEVAIYLQGPSDQTFVVGGNDVPAGTQLLDAHDVHVAAP
jgi:hypothetical protein